SGKKITWHACGPTVYDDAHLGHARNYVSTAIIRRVMRDYFGFQVIIIRGRQQYLFAEYLKEHTAVTRDVLETAKEAYSSYIRENLLLIDPDTNPDYFAEQAEREYGAVLRGGALDPGGKPGDAEAKIRMHVNTAKPAARMISEAQHQFNVNSESTTIAGDITSEAFYDATPDIFLPYIDSLKTSSVSGDAHEIFTKLTKKYEDHFTRDMRALNVLDPDEITRVSEYSTEIADFVAKIVDNEFGYVTPDGSVYPDIQQFEKAGHHYARLEPWNRKHQPLQRDGEGVLSKTAAAVHKRSPDNFALWKASRPGEPSWPSPWGPGRPGWHIECSAMASTKVCYFLHMGHLSVQGSKMSKSLKNFTTVSDALDRGDWTPRGLRIVFLLGALQIAMDNVHEYLSDSFNTPKVMTAISDLVSVFNTQDILSLNPTAVDAVAIWINRIVTILGLNGTASPDDAGIGWEGTNIPDAAKPSETPITADELCKILGQSSISDIEASDSARPFLAVIENFRSSISLLKSEPGGGDAGLSKQILPFCDRLRDIDLFNLGIYLEDRDDMPALVRPVTRDILQAREELAQQAKQKQTEKEKQERLVRERLERDKLSPLDMSKTEEFSAWDEDGMPVKDAAGEPVNKIRSKKLRKEWERQRKAHEALDQEMYTTQNKLYDDP
ncbi:tRNA synthetases class I (C) catalytic domain-containing protein, partial [Aspergillus stella-maris]|uniref:tRNA synthetases class I (C) catalytic domain-containing protein n=1 Tax=Aspergillus stella-maris TaxID=1810926 RepID=UPI003CCD448C